MIYKSDYLSPLGSILLAADNIGLTGLWFAGQKYFGMGLSEHSVQAETDIIKEAKRWLDRYFEGIVPNCLPPLHPIGTDFQKEVWDILCRIPYGETKSYRDVADILKKQRGIEKMSSQAVGGAVGHNRIAIIIPCHRVVGTNGSLVGYAGGIEKKAALLAKEKAAFINRK